MIVDVLLWGREVTPAQLATLRAWLGTLREDCSVNAELTRREEVALGNMMSNMREIKAAAQAAQAAEKEAKKQKKKGGKKAAAADGAAAAAAAGGKEKRTQNVQWDL